MVWSGSGKNCVAIGVYQSVNPFTGRNSHGWLISPGRMGSGEVISVC
jgi:hypothetical protein